MTAHNFLLLWYGIVLTNCNSPTLDSKSIETDLFSIDLQNIDSYRLGDWYVSINSKDTIFYNCGIYVDNLAETDPKVIYMPAFTQTEGKHFNIEQEFDSLQVILVRDRNYDIDRYRKQNIYFESIDGYDAKLTVPRVDEGIIGIYIDSLFVGYEGDATGTFGFNLFVKNPSKELKSSILRGLRTLKFKKK